MQLVNQILGLAGKAFMIYTLAFAIGFGTGAGSQGISSLTSTPVLGAFFIMFCFSLYVGLGITFVRKF